MGARYPYYLLADSSEGQSKEGEITRSPPKEKPTRGDIRHGFVHERVPHITLKSIANNAEIDVIWEKWQQTLEPLRTRLSAALGRSSPSLRGGEADEAISSGSPRRSAPRDDNAPWEEWEIPRVAAAGWPEEASRLHAEWWAARIATQREIDASIAAKAEFEYLYDKPYTDNSRIRVAGPFTVESLSPHRVMAVDEDDTLIDTLDLNEHGAGWNDFAQSFDWEACRAAIEYFSRIASPAAEKGECLILGGTGRKLSRVRAEGRFSDGPHTMQDRAAVRTINDHRPILVLSRQDGWEEDGWRGSAFWWPVLFAPARAAPSVFASTAPEAIDDEED